MIVVLLVAVEMAMISNASGYEVKEKVIFAKVHIDKNTVITADMLELREIGASAVHPDALKSKDDAVKKKSGMDIEAGEMMLEAKLSSVGREIILVKNRSNRLISVEFEVDQANGWQLAEEQYVDLIFVPNQSEQQKQPPGAVGMSAMAPATYGVKVLKNIRIAGIIDKEGKLVDILEPKDIPRYISFEVTEEQADFLAYAKNSGKLELSCVPGRE